MILLFYLNYFMIFLIFSLIFMLISLYMLSFKMSIYVEMGLLKFNGNSMTSLFFFDFKSIMFVSVVFMISSMIIIYSMKYMEGDLYSIKFLFLLTLFVFSMLLFILGQNLLTILLGWDGLGLISYCLVIYFNSWSSYNSGMITILTNRLGDVGLILSISLYSIYGGWNYLFLGDNNYSYFIYLVLLGALTKSAQVPFSSWLPRAMAAPTPISALVHSSTLVTAGIYLLMRMEEMIKFDKNLCLGILILSMLTMFYSGVVGVYEMDMKKIIALSTLSQLGLMLMGLIMLSDNYMYFHMIMHAMFKSLLFMCSGVILHFMGGNQDIRNLGGLNFMFFNTLMFFNCSNLSLCGFPFLSGFFSKDLILELTIMMNNNYWLVMIFYISIMLTVIYSFRLIYYSVVNFMKFLPMFLFGDDMALNLPMYVMYFYSIVGGWGMSNLFLIEGNLVYLKFTIKILLLLLILVSFYISMGLNKYFFEVMKDAKLVNFIYSMWMINKFSSYLNFSSLWLGGGMVEKIENGWMEIISLKFMMFFLVGVMSVSKMKLSIIMNLLLMILFFYFIIF
uniref:NADH-ubiquinone oxidoreductase chain 5 n=1 Tax=Scelio sp. ZJUH_2016028 TaxID=2496283 RepID=A0A3S8V176_9HYME|nr:NADH dehydrogenase subunit 5 [Scelio sp. ZJUH_2016028]